YRCKKGARPQVMIFTRSNDEKVAKLVKEIDAQLAKHQDIQLRAFVNMLAESKDVATAKVKKLAATSGAKLVPFVVPNEYENGPEDYGINAKAELTIIVANESKVVGNYAVASVADLDMKAAMGEVKKLIN